MVDHSSTSDFPSSVSLPLLLSAEGWSWARHPGGTRFWIGTNLAGARWLVKGRGGFKAARERAFSIIAQALDISCQSSTFVRLPLGCPPRASRDITPEIQSAIVYLDEQTEQVCTSGCLLQALWQQLDEVPHDLEVLRSSGVERAIDWARGEMLGMLCDMHEPPGQLVTCQHRFVQIDNELMFSRGAGADLWASPWVTNEVGEIQEEGVAEAVRLCRRVLALPYAVFDEAVLVPPHVDLEFSWDALIKPRAASFIALAEGRPDL